MLRELTVTPLTVQIFGVLLIAVSSTCEEPGNLMLFTEVLEMTPSRRLIRLEIVLASFLSSTTLPTNDFSSDTEPLS